MVVCVECGRKLGLLKGYQHPTMGKNYFLCTHCYDVVDESVKKWRTVVLTYSDFFSNSTPGNSHHFHFSYVQKKFPHGLKFMNRASPGKEI